MSEAPLIAGLLGAATGSFASAAAYRIPLGLSVIRGRSSCDHCGRHLEWYVLIPLFGYLLQRGKCHTCNGNIPVSYPLVEMLFVTIAVGTALRFGISAEFFATLFLAVMCVPIAVIDWKHLIIPDQLIVAALLAGCAAAFMRWDAAPGFLLASSLGSFLLLLAIRWLGTFVLGREAMGFGDVKLAAVIGLFTGFWVFLAALWIASISGSVYALVARRQGKIPFGAFLAVAGLFCHFFRDMLIGFYERFLAL